MKKTDFNAGWKIIFTLVFTAVGELAVMEIFQLDGSLRWFYLFTGIVLLVASYGLTQFVWKKADKFIHKRQLNKALSERLHPRPIIDYSWEENGGELYLRIKEYPQKDKLILTLQSHSIKMVSGIEEQQKSIEDAFRRITKRKIFKGEISPENLQRIKIMTKAENNKTVFFFPDSPIWIEAFPGRYLYEFEESIRYGERSWSAKNQIKYITVNSLEKIEL